MQDEPTKVDEQLEPDVAMPAEEVVTNDTPVVDEPVADDPVETPVGAPEVAEPVEAQPEVPAEPQGDMPFITSEQLEAYEHVPGTVHLNAFVVAVDQAKVNVVRAQAELDDAVRALENKKIEAGLV